MKLPKKTYAIFIGIASEVQYQLGIGVDYWEDAQLLVFRKICRIRNVTPPADILSILKNARRQGLLGGLRRRKNNSMPLQKCMDRLDAICQALKIDVPEWGD